MALRFLLIAVVALCHLTWISTCKEISQRAEKRFDVRGKEWMAAQKIINQLVDESIASRVSEAEHDIEHLLESNIAQHIKSTGKTLLRRLSKDCTDKIEHCQVLAKSGVCKTSKQAMQMHCAKTCDLCEVPSEDVTTHVNPEISAKPFVRKKEPQNSGTVRLKTNKYHSTVKVTPQKAQTEQSSRKNDLLKYEQGFIPEDTIKTLHSIEPLLSQQTDGVMKFHENDDLIPANEKIRDAQKLLEYVKVLKGPKTFNHELNSFENLAENRNQNSEQEKEGSKRDDKMEMGQNKKNDGNSKTSDKNKEKEHVKRNKKPGNNDKAKEKPKLNDKTKDKPKPIPTDTAAKSKEAKKKLKVKGTPSSSLSKTVRYKNQQYKITPVVDWEKISKMLESLGYKAVHIVGVKNKNVHKDLEDHLKKHGVHKIVGSKVKADKVAADTFVSAVHREKSWHNDQYFKAHCHPMCLKKCVSSCQPGCCPEHDKVSIKTGLANHCHPSCTKTCIPSCGSGCCSAEEEHKRGHNFLHYQKIENFHKAKDRAKQQEKEKATATLTAQKDMAKKHRKKQDKPDSSCHPQCKETCVESCGKGCCSDEAEKHRDEEEKKQKDEMEEEVKEKDATEANANAHDESTHDSAVQEIYKPQPRLCPAPCPTVCAPACADACCSFGRFAQSVTGRPPMRDEHPGFMPNVPYPHSKVIPAEAFACKESCKFSCTYDCPRDCCQPEELETEAAHEAAALASPTTIGSLQTMNYQGLVPEPPSCPSPCPGNCFPSCTVACCTSALGLPQKDNFNPLARSSTKRVLHVTHLVRPITSLDGCALSCAVHCTPICARSGCCDSLRRRRKRRRTQI